MSSKGQKKSLDSPVIDYFQRNYLTWDIIAYLKYTLLNDKSNFAGPETFKRKVQLAIDTWIKDLIKVEDEDTSQAKREKAANLLKGYRGALTEQIIYDAFRNVPESLAHSYIIDISDPKIMALFNSRDWAAICEKVLEWPESDESLARLIDIYSNHLRRVLNENPYPPIGETHDYDKHYDGCWIHLVFDMLHPLYQRRDQILLGEHDESWFDLNVWCVVLDRCLQGLEGMDLRTDSKKRRKMTGARHDGVYRDRCDRSEYSMVESSKTFDSETHTKWLGDSRKGRVEISRFKELQLAGLVTAGSDCQVLRVSYADGRNLGKYCTDEHFADESTKHTSIVNARPENTLATLMQRPKLLARYTQIPMTCDTDNEESDTAENEEHACSYDGDENEDHAYSQDDDENAGKWMSTLFRLQSSLTIRSDFDDLVHRLPTSTVGDTRTASTWIASSLNKTKKLHYNPRTQLSDVGSM
ncbi:hypothetical protein HOY82DRAFT_536906 [Tuber indicum]|nr:hypothetical protein HOY82DRAFT_536906 [Tuber indicum]